MRIAIIGLKGHHNVVTDGAREMGGCQIVAVSDDNPQAVSDFVAAEPLANGADTYADWRHLLEHAMFDLACVGDENGIRAEQLLALAARGGHIITEKPLTTNLDDLARVRAALNNSPGRMTMLLTMRHEAKYATMRRLVQEGAIGTVCQVTSQKSYRWGERPTWQMSRARLGGIIPFIGIHALDLMRWVTGLEYSRIAAFHGRLGKPEMLETEDSASILALFAGGATATARLDYLRPMTAPTHGDDRIRVAGGLGIIESVGDEPDLRLVTTSREPVRIPAEPTANLFVDFVNAIGENRPSRITADDAYRITELVLRARDSADGHGLVELPE
jgi:predicted dehydrogenase